jgi:hypothetical protein
MNYIRERLGAKLFLANLMVILIGVIILASIQITIPGIQSPHGYATYLAQVRVWTSP